jgi:hypothetical protein
MAIQVKAADDLVLRAAGATVEGNPTHPRMASVEMQRLGSGGVLCGGLLQLRRFGWRRGLRGSAAASPTTVAPRRKVLAGNPVVVGVEAIGIARFQVFLRFLLGRKVSAVVVAGDGRPCGEKKEGGGNEQREEGAETSDCARLTQH